MTRVTRRSTVVIAFVVALAMVATGCTKNRYAWDSAVLVNQERHNRGVHDLKLDDTLVNKAQAWAEHMARTGTVSHSVLTQGVGSNWRVLGENVGWARSAPEMHSMFMSSTSHRNTMLDRRYTRYGVGVSVLHGRHFTVQVFAG